MKRFLATSLIGTLVFIFAFGMTFTATAQYAHAGGTAQPSEFETKGCVGKYPGPVPIPRVNISSCVAVVANIVMWLSARTLWLSGILLNYSLGYTLNMQDMLQQIPIVDIGWKVMRDISNIVFIFLTLWAGISITLGIGDNGSKAWSLIAHIVLVALFINFSLFITKAVVDASNIVALHFYNLITPAEHREDWDGGLSEAFMSGLRLQTLYDSDSLKVAGFSPTGAGDIDDYLASKVGNTLNIVNIILLGVFGSILMMVAAFVFFSAAIMFVIRAVTLIMLMVLSPLAFVAWIIPGASGFANTWWSKLWSQSFFAPLYLALAYVVVATINSPAFTGLTNVAGGTDTFAAALTSDSPAFAGIIFSFIILIALMVGCLIVAQSLGARGSATMMSWGNKLRGTATGLAGRVVMRGFGTESLRNNLSNRSAELKERAETAKAEGNTGLHDQLMTKAKRYETASKLTPSLSVRELNEKWGRAGGMLGGKGLIGSVLREQTTDRLVKKATFGGSKTSEEAYDADEARISSLRDKEYGSQTTEAAAALKPTREKEEELQKERHKREKALAEARENLKEAKKAEKKARGTPEEAKKTADREAAEKAVAETRGEKYAEVKIEVEDARKAAEKAKGTPEEAAKVAVLATAESKLKALEGKGGVEESKDKIEEFSSANAKEIQLRTRRMATALARMSTEGFLQMQKSDLAIPEIMDISVLGADKYNALMASEDYNNAEKIEYTEARMHRVNTQADRMKEKQEWYLQDRKYWEKMKKEHKGKMSDWETKKTAYDTETERILNEPNTGKGWVANKAQEDVTHWTEMLAASATDDERTNAETHLTVAKDILAPAEVELKAARESRETGQEAAIGAAPVAPEKPTAPKWENDELRKAMRNMRDARELTNYYRYSRATIDKPAFVQTVLQGMWNKLRESPEVDSFTKEQNRVNKRLYMLEAAHYKNGMDPVLMKKLYAENPDLATEIDQEINKYIIDNSEEEYKKEYWTVNPETGTSKLADILKKAGVEDNADEEERSLRHETGDELMDEVLQNLANDEATMMPGSLRNLHWIKSVLNRALFSDFKDRDLDVKIPDIQNLIHSVGEMLKGNNKLSEGNIDFLVYLTNERDGKRFIPYEQMDLSDEERQLWEAIKALAKQRDDNLGSTFKTKQEALAWLHKHGYRKPGQKVESPWRTAGVKSRTEAEKPDSEFYNYPTS